MTDPISPTASIGSDAAPWAVSRRRSMAAQERQFLLAAVDCIVILLIARALSWIQWGPGHFAELALAAAPAWLVAGHFANLYDVSTAGHTLSSILALTRTAIAVGALMLVIFFLHPYVVSRENLILLTVLTPTGVAVWRLVYVRYFGAGAFDRRVLVIGAGKSAQALIRAVRQNHRSGISVVGIVDDDPMKWNSEIEGVPVLGGSGAIWSTVANLHVEQVVLAVSQPMQDALFDGLGVCYERGIAVALMPHLYEELTGTVPVEHAGRHWYGTVPLTTTGGRLYASTKRVIDILASGVALAISAPIMLLVALAVRFSSPGPVLFRQPRVGYCGHTFMVIKFRTMYVESANRSWTGDPSTPRPMVTPVGKWLRRLHLDELPQLFLVLRGDMSLVGPRPKRADQARILELSVPLYRARYSVRPGLTGWAQVRYRYAASSDDERVKLRYDLYYIKHQSLLLDLSILVRTVAQVLGMRGF